MALVIALLGYSAFQVGRSVRDADVVPHWTTAIAAGTAALLLEGHALTVLLGGSVGWTYQLIGIAAFALVGPATLAWTIIGALWLRHRSHHHRPRHAARSATVRVGTRTVTN